MLDFEEQMKKLKKINGYVGSAILNYSGETLYIDDSETSNDIAYSASVYNDSFRAISESAIDIGFSDASFTETKTSDGYIFIIQTSASEDIQYQVNIFTIFRDDGNIGLCKIVLNKIAQTIKEEFSKI